jgi:hypothetical protein
MNNAATFQATILTLTTIIIHKSGAIALTGLFRPISGHVLENFEAQLRSVVRAILVRGIAANTPAYYHALNELTGRILCDFPGISEDHCSGPKAEYEALYAHICDWAYEQAEREELLAA